jgi:hypothetical protein
MSVEYNDYLVQHRNNVRKAFDWIKENCPRLVPEGFDNGTGNHEWEIRINHDESKTKSDEYKAYDAYFYGGNRSAAVVENFNHAWLRHIHRNPHHWQHWLLAKDEGGMTPLEMPYGFILEMICDWWSFSWQKGDLYNIFDWYEMHSSVMQLGVKTRKTVEDILASIKERLKILALSPEREEEKENEFV